MSEAREVSIGEEIDIEIRQKMGLYEKHVHVLSEMNKTIACSAAKAERDLGYDPRVSLEEGMRGSILWCQERDYL